jgi:hypothetical protein
MDDKTWAEIRRRQAALTDFLRLRPDVVDKVLSEVTDSPRKKPQPRKVRHRRSR